MKSGVSPRYVHDIQFSITNASSIKKGGGLVAHHGYFNSPKMG